MMIVDRFGMMIVDRFGMMIVDRFGMMNVDIETPRGDAMHVPTLEDEKTVTSTYAI